MSDVAERYRRVARRFTQRVNEVPVAAWEHQHAASAAYQMLPDEPEVRASAPAHDLPLIMPEDVTPPEELRANWKESKRWQPTWSAEQREEGYAGWKKAVQRTLDWVDVG